MLLVFYNQMKSSQGIFEKRSELIYLGIVEFVVLDDVPVGFSFETNREIVMIEGAVRDQKVAGAIQIDCFRVLSVSIVSKCQVLDVYILCAS